jgi:hypothetical protein
MNASLAYRIIAITNGVLGLILAVGVLAGIKAVLSADKDIIGAFIAANLLIVGLIATTLLYGAISHIRKPSQATALAVAFSSSIILWFLFTRLLKFTPIQHVIGPGHILIAIPLAYLFHRLVLKPLAIRAYPQTMKEPNQALEPTLTAVTDRAAHAPRQL